MSNAMLAMPEVHIMKEDPLGGLVLICEFYKAPWEDICMKVNSHNDLYVKGDVDWIMRVFCPWEGDELYVPKV